MPTHSKVCPTCGAPMFADGGEVEADPSDFPKRDHELPDVEPSYYEGETAKAEHAARRARDAEGEDDVDHAAFAAALRKKRRAY